MFNINKKVEDRLKAGIKKYQALLTNAKSQDINENDTVRIISGILEDVLGYDRFSEISSELNVKGTYCDLCIKIDNDIKVLIEAKAVEIELKPNHLKQAIDYGANKGIDWVILTNGVNWQVYRVLFAKPLNQELVFEINFLGINPKNQSDIDDLYLLSKESLSKLILEKYYTQRKALSKYYLGAIILNDEILDKLKREIKKLAPEVKVTNEEISEVLTGEVIKREIIESEKFVEAQKVINRMYHKREKEKESKDDTENKIESLPGQETTNRM